MRVCIGIPTWNRADVLVQTLERLCGVLCPDGVRYEVIVVDNNSTDHTQRVLQEYHSTIPIHKLFERQQGRSWALNRALAFAQGDYIIWIDDDILVGDDWLVAYCDAFRRYPEAAVFGGTIIPKLNDEPPPWFPDALGVIGGVFGKCSPPSGAIDPNGPFLPFGGNMALRLDVHKLYPFDVTLGRQGGNLLADEEAKVIRQVISSGHVGQWVPDARVEHVVPKSYLSLKHVRRYFHDRGVSAFSGDHREEVPTIAGRPRWAWRQAIQGEFNYKLGRLISRPPSVWLRDMAQASFAWGVLAGRPKSSKG
jgi:glucosyl-dolichyl phosphate glucuronosyltransferase